MDKRELNELEKEIRKVNRMDPRIREEFDKSKPIRLKI